MTDEDYKKYAVIQHDVKKQNAKLREESKRFGAKINDRDLKIVDVDEENKLNNTFGNRLADIVARAGGSWGYIGGFAIFIFAWVVLNTWSYTNHFDVYPFILLNLFLSIITAFQSPLIMKSQNRQSEKDKLVRDNDYRTNQKTNAEMKLIHSKLDHQVRLENDLHKKLDILVKK